MTSIFNTSFSENLKRVNANAERPAQPSAKDKKVAGESFSKVLAELEKKTAHPGGKKEEGAIKGDKSTFPPELYLTSDDPVYALTRHGQDKLECTPLECSFDSKVEGSLVSNRSPLEIGEEVERPEVPVVRSIERISMPVTSSSIKAPIRYRRDEIENIISTAGKYHGIDPTLGKAVAQAESSFRPDAVSQDGHASKGIFQLLDSTAGDLVQRFNFKEQYDPFDPAQNAYLGVGYLRRLHDIFSSETNLGGNLKTVPVKSADDLEKVALAAFNAGEGNVASAQRAAARRGSDPAVFENISPFLPPSTRAYVERVTQFRTVIAKNDGGNEIV